MGRLICIDEDLILREINKLEKELERLREEHKYAQRKFMDEKLPWETREKFYHYADALLERIVNVAEKRNLLRKILQMGRTTEVCFSEKR